MPHPPSAAANPLSRAVTRGLVDPSPAPLPMGAGALEEGPRLPDLAALWTKGGSQLNAWPGSLGLLMQEEALDGAMEKAVLQMETAYEGFRLREAVMAWASGIFSPVSGKTGEETSKKPAGAWLAEISLFGIPVLASPETVENVLGDNRFASLLRENGVFDSTSVVAFLGHLPASRALALSPQELASITRILRPEILRFHETGDPALSRMASGVFLERFFSTPGDKLEEELEEGAEEVQVMVGVRMALCHRDGHPHDVLGERRTVAEDEEALGLWHQLALEHVKSVNPGVFMLGDPCLLGRSGRPVLELLVEGRIALEASRSRRQAGKVVLSHEGEHLQVQVMDGKDVPWLVFHLPWGRVAPHLPGWVRGLDNRFVVDFPKG